MIWLHKAAVKIEAQFLKPCLLREEATNNESLGSRFCCFVGRGPYLYQAPWNVSPIKLSATSPRGTQFCFRVSLYLYDRFAHYCVIQSADGTIPGGFSLVVAFPVNDCHV